MFSTEKERRYTPKTSITFDDKLRLAGLMLLAADSSAFLKKLAEMACQITGEEVDSGNHTWSAIHDGDPRIMKVDDLLKILGLKVEDEPRVGAHPEGSQ